MQIPGASAPATGPPPALSDSAVITLLGFSQWRRFASERDFYRYAETQLRDAFPRLPNRSQFNRHARRCYDLPAAFWRYQADLLEYPEGLYQALDRTAVPTRAAKRRGKVGCSAKPTSATAIAWSGLPACICCWLRARPATLPGLV